ncbi:N-formylglutamate amidohydrolase [Sphingomonas sp. XMGL2]|uniref:N-formylglutamate amidohydrolase n=1 Tax=Sphingomonas quercus TaxID=2842451 RepID=A0ABS6BLS2_9SPHN|nr:N-formylglutamate amidohydrolase [Sphingomonas quercus]
MTSPSESGGAEPVFLRLGPAIPTHPVVITVPHAGRDYPPPLLAAARVGTHALQALEDRHADLLIEAAVAGGAVALVARRARAWIDLNRGERELDRTMIDPAPPAAQIDETAKVRGGLGLIPRRGPGGAELWRRGFAPDEVAARIAADHRPWHGAIESLLAATRARFGVAVLLDLHSMPPLPPGRLGKPPQLVTGDRHGRSAAGWGRGVLAAQARAAGLVHAANTPYAGGETLARHGRPEANIHALQLEIDRALYLAPDLRTPGLGLGDMTALVARMTAALAAVALGSVQSIAAE